MSESLSSAVLLDRYLAGECTPEEVFAIERILPPRSAEADALFGFVAATAAGDRPVTPARHALRAFHARRTSTPRMWSRTAPRNTVLMKRRSSMLGVAGVMALAVVGLAIRVQWPDVGTPSAEATRPQIQELRTRPAQRAHFTLPDGSSVVLGPDSRLRYPMTFGGATRDVELDGQALFTVTRHGAQAFVVRAAETRVRVLGTSFTVRRYASDSAVRVVVAQGRVAVGEAVLGTGESGVTRDGAHVEVSRGVNVASEFGWVDGRLILNEVPLRDAVAELERWYDITIVVRDSSLLTKRVVTTLTTEPAQEALSLVAMALNAQLTFTHKRAILSAR